MQGPYSELVPLSQQDCALAVPHLSSQLHILKLSGEVSVIHLYVAPVEQAQVYYLPILIEGNEG